jgi:hypothetical protein
MEHPAAKASANRHRDLSRLRHGEYRVQRLVAGPGLVVSSNAQAVPYAVLQRYSITIALERLSQRRDLLLGLPRRAFDGRVVIFFGPNSDSFGGPGPRGGDFSPGIGIVGLGSVHATRRASFADTPQTKHLPSPAGITWFAICLCYLGPPRSLEAMRPLTQSAIVRGIHWRPPWFLAPSKHTRSAQFARYHRAWRPRTWTCARK